MGAETLNPRQAAEISSSVACADLSDDELKELQGGRTPELVVEEGFLRCAGPRYERLQHDLCARKPCKLFASQEEIEQRG